MELTNCNSLMNYQIYFDLSFCFSPKINLLKTNFDKDDMGGKLYGIIPKCSSIDNKLFPRNVHFVRHCLGICKLSTSTNRDLIVT